MIIVPQVFQDIVPTDVSEKAWTILGRINKFAALNGLVTPHRKAMFLAHACVESAWFTKLEENLNYRAPRLIQVFRAYRLRPDLAVSEAGKPQLIANRAYAGKNGNGDVKSGDGWTYRGRGIFQLTGRGNYRSASMDIYGDDRLIKSPFLLTEPEAAVDTAFWYWKTRKMNDVYDLVRSTEIINGGRHGLDERIKAYNDFLKAVV
jgi:putative chitinase